MTSATSIGPPSSTTELRHVRQHRDAQRGVSALMYAAQQGDIQTLRKILRAKPAAVFERDRTGKSPLHYCCTSDSICAAQAADYLVMAAPDLVENRDEDGFTPLHLAVIAGNMPLVTFLLANGADVNAVDNEQHTVVHWATVCGETAALQAVIAAGATVSTPDVHGGYPLHYAAQMCGGEKDSGLGMHVLQTLLTHSDIDVSVEDGDGRQPLLWAASAGSAKALLALIRAGAVVESCDKDGLTALHCAASRGHTDCIDCLLTLCGASPDVIDSNGCTALHYAVTLGHADATALLLAHGADSNRQDRKGRSPAHCGCAKGQFETVRMIGAHGANLWLKNARGDLPLHEAAASGRRELVMWLLEMRPSQVNARNNDGRCPLHLAALNDNADMCKILLDSGAQINPILRTSKNVFMTPLDCALQRGFRSTAKFLQLHGGVPASRLAESKPNIKLSTTFKIREDTKLMTDSSSSESEKEPKKILHPRKKIGKREKNGRMVPGSGLIVKNGEKFKRVEADSIDLAKRTAYKSRRLDYSNEIIINGNTEINIHQTKEFITTSNGQAKVKSAKSVKRTNGTANIIDIKDDGIKITTAAEEIKEKVAQNEKLIHLSPNGLSQKQSLLPEQLSLISNTSDDVEIEKKVVVEASVHPPPREQREKEIQVAHDVPVETINTETKIAQNPEILGQVLTDQKDVTKKLETDDKKETTKDTATDIVMEQKAEKMSEDSQDVEITKKILAGIPQEIDNAIEKSTEQIANLKDEVIKDVDTIKDDPSTKNLDEVIAQELIQCSEQSQSKQPVEDSQQVEQIIDRSSRVSGVSENEKEEQEAVKAIEEDLKSVEKTEPAGKGTDEKQEKELKEHQVQPALHEKGGDQESPEMESEPKEHVIETTKETKATPSTAVPVEMESEVDKKSKKAKISSGKAKEETESSPTQLDTSTKSSTKKKFVKTKTIQSRSSEDEISTSPHTDLSTSSTGTVKEHKSFRVLDEEEEAKSLKDKKQRSRLEEKKKKENKSKIPTPLSKRKSRIDQHLQSRKSDKTSSYLDSRIPSLPNIHDANKAEIPDEKLRKEANRSAPNLASVYSDNERGSMSEEEEEEKRGSAVRKKRVKRRLKHRESRSAGSDYESSNVIDSGFEPSPRSSRIPKWKNMSDRGVNMTSVTQSIQTNIRRYHLERKIFQHLLDLKRLQIRAGQHNEVLLVKRAIDSYHQSCASTVGAGKYIPEDYTFKSFEKFLYLSLRKLQRNGADHLKGLPESPNPLQCTKSTHRCMHTTHAYTGIPCAAYLPKMDHHTMPKIGFNSTQCKPGTGGSFLPTINSKKAVTLELCHGNDKQVISLPADRLDQNKRYYVTFTVKGNDSSNSAGEDQVGHKHSKSD